MSSRAIFTIVYDGETSHFYTQHCTPYDISHIVMQANKIASEHDMDIHGAFECMGDDAQYMDVCSPEHKLFEKLSDDVVQVMLDGFGKTASIAQDLTFDFDEGTISYKYNNLCFTNTIEDHNGAMPEDWMPEQDQTQGQNMSM